MCQDFLFIHSQIPLHKTGTYAAREKVQVVIKKLETQKLRQANQVVRQGINRTLTYYDLPDANWRRIRTNNQLERNSARGAQTNSRGGCIPRR